MKEVILFMCITSHGNLLYSINMYAIISNRVYEENKKYLTGCYDDVNFFKNNPNGTRVIQKLNEIVGTPGEVNEYKELLSLLADKEKLDATRIKDFSDSLKSLEQKVFYEGLTKVLKNFLVELDVLNQLLYKGMYIFQNVEASDYKYLDWKFNLNELDVKVTSLLKGSNLDNRKPRYKLSLRLSEDYCKRLREKMRLSRKSKNLSRLFKWYIFEILYAPTLYDFMLANPVAKEGDLLENYSIYDGNRELFVPSLELKYVMYAYELLLGQDKALCIKSDFFVNKESIEGLSNENLVFDNGVENLSKSKLLLTEYKKHLRKNPKSEIIVRNNYNESGYSMHSSDQFKVQAGLAFGLRLWSKWFKDVLLTETLQLNSSFYAYFLKNFHRVGYSEIYFNNVRTGEEIIGLESSKQLEELSYKKVDMMNFYDYNSMYGSLLESGEFPLGNSYGMTLEYIQSSKLSDYKGLVYVEIVHDMDLLKRILSNFNKKSIVELNEREIQLIKKEYPGLYAPYLNTGEINVPFNLIKELEGINIKKQVLRHYCLIGKPVRLWLTKEEVNYCLSINYLIKPLYGINFVEGYENYTSGLTTYMFSLLKEYTLEDLNEYNSKKSTTKNFVNLNELFTDKKVPWPYFSNANPLTKTHLKLSINGLIGAFAETNHRYKAFCEAIAKKQVTHDLEVSFQLGYFQDKLMGKLGGDILINIFILTRSRMKMHKEICKNLRDGADVIYCATDSILTTQELPSSTKIGDLKLEIDNINSFFGNNIGVYMVHNNDITRYKYQGLTNDSPQKTLSTYIERRSNYFIGKDYLSDIDINHVVDIGVTGRVVFCDKPRNTVLESFPLILNYLPEQESGLFDMDLNYSVKDINYSFFIPLNSDKSSDKKLENLYNRLVTRKTSITKMPKLKVSLTTLDSIRIKESDYLQYSKIFIEDLEGVKYLLNVQAKEMERKNIF